MARFFPLHVLAFLIMLCGVIWGAAALPALGQIAQPSAMIDAAGEELPKGDTLYPFAANDITVAEALRLFSRNLRIGLAIDEDFDGSAKANIDLKLTRQGYLEELASLFDFSWYFDGDILHISSVGEIETQIFSLQKTNGNELISMLVSLGVYQPRFRHRADDRRRALLVSGPKTYLGVVAKVVEAVETSEQRKVTIVRGAAGVNTTAVGSTAGASSVPDTTTAPLSTPSE